MGQPQYARAGSVWYVSDGLIWDSFPPEYRAEGGRPRECSSKLYVFNPQRRSARVTARFYHTNRRPTATSLTVRAGEIEALELATMSGVPHRQAFWIAVESSLPVLPQACHEDYRGWDPVPDALISPAPYPGPLTDETKWVFPDCFNMAPHPRLSWYEQETLSLLNPNKEPVRVHVQYLLRGCDGGAEETVEVQAERVAQLDVWARGPRPIGERRGAPVRMADSHEYVVHLDASAPIVAQTTRRARWVGEPSVIGARSTMGFPLRKGSHDLWHYPAGEIVGRGILPRATPTDHPLSQCDNTWNLLFIHDLDATRDAQAVATFHKADGSCTQSGPIVVPAFKSSLECLHGAPWLGEQVQVNEPYGLTVRADRPVVPEMCCAEFEMWSQVCPGAMSAVNFYPGPLRDERSWWLGIGRAGGRDDLNVEWSQSYHLLNPGRKRVEVTLSFLGLGRRGRALSRSVLLAPGAVARVHSADIPGLPADVPFAVKADGDGPFYAQTFIRTFTRGLPHSRAMSSMMGLPMALVE
jgi:hypothetical protein